MSVKCPLCKGNMRGNPRGLCCSSCGAEGLRYKGGTVVAVRMAGEPGAHTMRYRLAAYGPQADTALQQWQGYMDKAMKARRA